MFFLPLWCSKVSFFIASFLFREPPLVILHSFRSPMTNYLSFLLTENVLTSSWFFEDNFTGYTFLVWHFFYHLKIFFYFFLTTVISDDKSAVIWIVLCLPSPVDKLPFFFFFLADFNIFFVCFSSVFRNLIIMRLWVDFFGSYSWKWLGTVSLSPGGDVSPNFPHGLCWYLRDKEEHLVTAG